MARVLKAWGAGCAGQLLLELALAVVVGGSVVAELLVFGFAPLPPALEPYRTLLIGGGLAGVLALYVGLAAVWAGWTLFRQRRQLDAAFAPLGLTGRRYLLTGRRYAGRVQGRAVEAWFYRGPTLDMFVSASLSTRMGIAAHEGMGAALAGAFRRPPMALADHSALARLDFFPQDEAWARALLAAPEAGSALLRLIPPPADLGAYELRQVYLQLERVSVKLYRTRLNQLQTDNLRAWLADLLTLARLAEALPRSG